MRSYAFNMNAFVASGYEVDSELIYISAFDSICDWYWGVSKLKCFA